jgi:hypothetical protein
MIILLFSQPPVIGRAGFAVGLFHVYLGDLGIMTHHVQDAVTQQRFAG